MSFKENPLILEGVSHNFLQMGDFGSHNKKWDHGVFQMFFSQGFVLVVGLSSILGDFNDFLKMFSM